MLNLVNEPHHCSKDALTGFISWMLQGVLAGLAFTCLIAKRFREPPGIRRTWETWWYDTSKQGIGAIVIHLTNVYLAPLFQGDPCTWYVINFLLDSTIGLLIVFIGIRLCQFLAHYNKWPAINFGVYDAPKSWIYQTWIYIGLMAIVKIFTTLFIQLQFWDSVKNLVLTPFSNETIELILMMLVIPFLVNLLIFWVTDNFLMRHDHQQNKSFLINYVGKCNSGINNGGPANTNGKLGTNTLFNRAKNHYKRVISNNSSSVSCSNSSTSNNKFILKVNDSESDALISGDENFDIDDNEMYGDRIALERCVHGMGSTSSLDSSSARRFHRNSVIVNP